MGSTVFEHTGPWQFSELTDLPDDGRRYEVVDGALVVTPPPGHLHQAVGALLLRQLVRQCPPSWRVYYAFALPLGSDGRVPDLAVVSAQAPLRGRARTRSGRSTSGWSSRWSARRAARPTASPSPASTPRRGEVPAPWGDVAVDLRELPG